VWNAEKQINKNLLLLLCQLKTLISEQWPIKVRDLAMICGDYERKSFDFLSKTRAGAVVPNFRN
jgi:hypothetical protein